jgi:hypothetical protein
MELTRGALICFTTWAHTLPPLRCVLTREEFNPNKEFDVNDFFFLSLHFLES